MSLTRYFMNLYTDLYFNVIDCKLNKRSVLRRQSRDTNRNIKRSVYCQYG